MKTTPESINIDTIETKVSTLPWQDTGRSYTRTGYGKKIPTVKMARLPGESRWRRVYCCIYSNSGTCYVIKRGKMIVLY